MDLWAWVVRTGKELRDNGRGDVARMIDALPSAVVDDEYERVDAIVPEAIAAARSLKQPWLEVFFKHWELQSRVLHRGQGKAALRDAVALMELSHREETKDCPQSVCTVQDLCACYGHADGPGYATEREAAAKETLARIDPTWPCWSCVGTELATAMSASGRTEAALAELDRLIAAQLLAGDARARWDFELSRATFLNDLGRFEEALSLSLEGERHGRDNVNAQRERALQKSRALVGLGRLPEARDAMPAYATIAATPAQFPTWIEVREALVGAGIVANDGELGLAVLTQVDKLTAQGCPRSVIEVGARGVRLALARGAVEGARLVLARMDAALPELARPLDGPAVVATARAAVDAAEAAIVLPETPEALLAEMTGPREAPEADLARLEPGLRRWPEHAGLRQVVAAARFAAGMPGRALELVEPLLVPGVAEDVVMLASEAAIQEGADTAVRVADTIRRVAENPWIADWILGRAAYGREDWPAAITALRTVAERAPEGKNVRRLLAAAAQRQGDHAAALEWFDALIQLGDEPGAVDWDRMVSATIVGAWDKVRESSVRLGMTFPGEGPIEVAWTLCKVRMLDEDGDEEDLWARRTGPVTARILSIKPSKVPQVWGRNVVFRAVVLNDVDAADKEPIYVYPWVADLGQLPTWTFEIDGVMPPTWPIIEAAMDAFGGECRVMSGASYSLRGELPGVYACVVVPSRVDPLDVHARLTELAEPLLHPIIWPVLAAIVGDTAALTRMQAAATAYDIE